MKTIELKSGIGYKANQVEPIIIDYLDSIDIKYLEEYAKKNNIELITIDTKKMSFQSIN